VTSRASPAWAASYDLRGVRFAVLNEDGTRVIGSESFAVQQANGESVLIGRGAFADGESDVERDELRPSNGSDVPLLVRFEHVFFNADGSRKIAGSADLRTGQASCSTYDNGQQHQLDSQIQFPGDTYAGASIVMAMQHALRRDLHDFSFHVFDCAPGPKMAAVEVTSVDEHGAWAYHSGDLAKAEITAHMSVIGAGLIEGLLPHRNVWFDPNAGWEYIGGKIHRYFADSQKVLLVRQPALPRDASAN
jgi:hypothetical protein